MTIRSGAELPARVLHPGSGTGELLLLDEPLSFWGGVDPAGRIVDRHHPQRGTAVTGRVLAMTSGRGSSSSSSVLAEQIRAGVAPAAVLLAEPEVILALGAIVAAELYGTALPVVQLAPADFAMLLRGRQGRVVVTVDAPGHGTGSVRLTPST